MRAPYGPRLAAAALAAVVLTLAPAAAPASPYSDINHAAAVDPITVHNLRGKLAMLSGSGGNIGVLTGKDGTLLVDTGIAVSSAKIAAALRGLGADRLRYVIDTHWHWDHTDGNGWARRMGATIIADPHTIARLTQTNRIVEWEHTFTPVPKADLPTQALSGDKTLNFDGETVRIRHYVHSHTDGDLSVYFVRADVLATGDTFWNGMYPFIDYVTGGSIDGAIKAANANLEMANARTLVIPGHGPAGTRAQLKAFRDTLVAVRGKVAALKAKGLSEAQVVAAHPTAAYDATWGRSVISGKLFTALVYRGV